MESASPMPRVNASSFCLQRPRGVVDIGAGNSAKVSDVCVEDLLKPLSSPDPRVRQASCQALGRTSWRSDPRVASALVGSLEDRDQYVRQAAASSLGQAARRGDEMSVLALTTHLTDVDPGVRRVACTALGQVLMKGQNAAFFGIIARLEDRDGGVRRAALKAIEKFVERGDRKIISVLLKSSSDNEAFVRQSAVEVLSRAAEEGDREVVERMLVLLETDRDARVRWASCEALGRLAKRGDSVVLAGLLKRLDDEADSVRRSAANALGHVTFAPLEELRLQERHIAAVEKRTATEVERRDRVIADMEDKHSMEVMLLQRRVDELEEQLKIRNRRIEELEDITCRQEWLGRVAEFMPHAAEVTCFLGTLPALSGPEHYGSEILAPVWALRCLTASPANEAKGQCGKRRPSMAGNEGAVDGRDKRWLWSLFEMFEQLSTGQVTPFDLTDKRPLNVYVHKGADETWGLYCSSRSRIFALLMRQACARNLHILVKCIIRPKDDQTFWAWQWANFFDGSDGLLLKMKATSSQRLCSILAPRSRSTSPSGSRASSPSPKSVGPGLTRLFMRSASEGRRGVAGCFLRSQVSASNQSASRTAFKTSRFEVAAAMAAASQDPKAVTPRGFGGCGGSCKSFARGKRSAAPVHVISSPSQDD